MSGCKLLAVIKGILLWLMVFIPSTITGTILVLVTGNLVPSTVFMQLLFIVLSMVAVKFILKSKFGIIGFRTTSFINILTALLLSFIVATLIIYMEFHIAYAERFQFPIPEIRQNIILYFLVAFVLAPTGEETLFRGLLLGYMLESQANPWIAITTAALLFSLIHVAPFSATPIMQRAFIVATAFIMSTISGYLRKQSRSLLPAIVTHIGFNLSRFVITFLT